MGELLHLRLDKRMRDEMKEIVKTNLFSSESEFVRDSIRKNIESYNKIKALEALRHSIPKKGKKSKSSNLFREFGLEE